MAAAFPPGISQPTAPEALPTVPEIESVSDINAATYDAVIYVTSDPTSKAEVAEPIASSVPRLASVSNPPRLSYTQPW